MIKQGSTEGIKMGSIDEQLLEKYRKETYRLNSGRQVRSPAEAVQFVNERGFVFFWPVKGFELPSLWKAVAGDRPVPNEHDDPGHVTWGWKDSMLNKKRWYYGKLLRKRATMVSIEIIPYFYALSERVGDLDDYLFLYDEGKLTFEEKTIAEALLKHGALNTIELRQKALLSAKSAKSRFERALASLQGGLWVLPVGVAEAGAWRYSFIYELFDRWYPQVVDKARGISRKDAYQKLISLYLESLGVASSKEIGHLFRWETDIVMDALEGLVAGELVVPVGEDKWAAARLIQ